MRVAVDGALIELMPLEQPVIGRAAASAKARTANRRRATVVNMVGVLSRKRRTVSALESPSSQPRCRPRRRDIIEFSRAHTCAVGAPARARTNLWRCGAQPWKRER